MSNLRRTGYGASVTQTAACLLLPTARDGQMAMMIMPESSDGWTERAAAAAALYSQRHAAVGRLASAKIAALATARRDWQQAAGKAASKRV